MTFSILARDPATGELGVAVQSHYFSVGPVVPWAAPGVGAVATQAMVRADYGPRGLALMAGGTPAPEALAQLRAQDDGGAMRQVAMLDAGGQVAAFTGPGCLAAAGDVQGDGVSCQGNILASGAVWPAMLTGYQAAGGPLAGRLRAALNAALGAGGDLRGMQSAALLVVPATGEPWETVVSLRVEDSSAPLDELDRLLRLHEAYAVASGADEHIARGAPATAAQEFRRAATLAPGQIELRFWAALGLADAGEETAALAELQAILAEQPVWREVLARLTPEVAPSAAGLLARLA